MTSVNISTTKNTVEVIDATTNVIEVSTTGPQGPAIPDGNKGDITVSDNGDNIVINSDVVTYDKIQDLTTANRVLGGSAAGTLGEVQITDAMVASAADISGSKLLDDSVPLTKLGSGALPSDITIATENIPDFTIVNADVSASAAISGSKITPDFGSQSIISTGNISGAVVTGTSFSGDGASITNINAANISTGQINSARVPTLNQNTTGSAAKLTTARTIAGVSFDGSANIDISYANLTNKLTVGDGGLTQNNFTNTLKTKLDGIESGATADQTASEIKTLLQSDKLTVDEIADGQINSAKIVNGSIVNVDINASAGISISKLGVLSANTLVGRRVSNGTPQELTASQVRTILNVENGATGDQTASEILTLLSDQDIATTGTLGSGNITITGSQPALKFIDDGSNPDYNLYNNNGVLRLYDITNAADRLVVNTDGHIDVKGNLDCEAGIDVTGNVSVTGTVDGVDIAARNTLFGGLTSSSGVLTDGVTATTQSAGDNSTKVATTAYTDTAISNLVDSAPNTLNTLKELSDALGSDANFSTTVTNSIATKMPTAGGAFTGDITTKNMTPPSGVTNIDIGSSSLKYRNIFASGNITVDGTVDGRDLATDGTKLDGIESNATADQTASEIVALVADQTIAPSTIDMDDNEKIKLGTGDDLELFHTGSISYIENTAGNLHIRNQASSGQIKLQPKSGEDGINVIQDSSVELYFDNSKKLETTADGITVQQGITVNGVEGGAAQIRLRADEGDDNNDMFRLLVEDGGAGLKIQNYDGSFNDKLVIDSSGNVGIGTSPSRQLHLVGSNPMILIEGNGGNGRQYALASSDDTTGAAVDGGNAGTFAIYDDTANVARLVINSSGNVGIGTTSPSGGKLHVVGSGNTGIKVQVGSSSVDQIYLGNTGGASSVGTLTNVGFNLIQNGGTALSIDTSKNINIPNDTGKLQLGASSDLKILHDGSGSSIDNATGQLAIACDDAINLQSKTGAEYYFRGFLNDRSELYYDGSKKFETTSTGAKVTGLLDVINNGNVNTKVECTATGSGANAGLNLKSADGGDYFLQTGNAVSGGLRIFDATASATRMTIDSDGDVLVGLTTALSTQAGSIQAAGPIISKSYINAHTSNAAVLQYISNKAVLRAYGATSGSGILQFNVGGGGDTTDFEAMRIDSSGNVSVGGTSPSTQSAKFQTRGTSQNATRINMHHEGNSSASISANGGLVFASDTSNGTTERMVIDTSGNLNISNDSGKLQLGASQDLRLYHDGTNSAIQNTVGELLIYGGNDEIRIQAENTEDNLIARPNGSTELYFDNVKRLETTSGGVGVSGFLDIPSDSSRLRLGASDDLQIYHNGSNSVIEDSGTGNLNILTSALAVKNTASNENMIVASQNGNVELYYDNSKKLETTSFGVQILDLFKLDNTTTAGRDVIWNPTTDKFQFMDNTKATFGLDADLQIYHDGSQNAINSFTSNPLNIISNGNTTIKTNNNDSMAVFKKNDATELYFDNTKKFETTSAGASITGRLDLSDNLDMPDNAKIILGTGDDLKLYHDGSNSFISETGTGVLKISGGSGVFINNEDNSEFIAAFVQNGAVELFYDHSKKLETTSTGIDVTGNITTSGQINISGTQPRLYLQDTNNDDDFSIYNLNGTFTIYNETDNVSNLTINSSGNVQIPNDSGKLQLGSSQDLAIYHNGSHSYIEESGTGNLYIRSSNTRMQSSAGEDQILLAENGAVELFFDNSKKIETTSSGVEVDGQLEIDGSVGETILKSSGAEIEFTRAASSNITCSHASGSLIINTGGSNERMRINASGDVLIGRTSAGNTGFGHTLRGSDSVIFSRDATGETVQISRNSNDGPLVQFRSGDSGNASVLATIAKSGSSVVYNTSSDYRLKENAVAISDGIRRLKTLKPYRFNFKADASKTIDGFFAHEVTPSVPEAITGTKDAVDSDNNPIYQQIDQSKLVPLLVAAVQELIGKVEALEAA